MSDNALNTDRELWREVADDYYAPSIHVTASNGISINVGGTVYVKSIRDWHDLASHIARQEVRIIELEAADRSSQKFCWDLVMRCAEGLKLLPPAQSGVSQPDPIFAEKGKQHQSPG